MAGVVKVKGVSGVLGDLVIPPLSLGALEQLQERIKAFDGDALKVENVAVVIDAATAALKRNYSDMTREAVGELVDVGNMFEVFQACMDVSGMVRKAKEAEASAAGEGAPPGEA
jgi:hypothetical protein